jgi:hypothetical protein
MPLTAVQQFTGPAVRAYVARVEDVIPAKRTLVAKINTSCIDRYGTVIEPKGIDRRNFDRNPVVLYEHGFDARRGSLPVARSKWTRIGTGPNGPELLAQPEFYGPGNKGDDFTELLWECYRDGDLRAFSVRVIPTADCGPPTKEEIRARPELVDCQWMYRKSELAEYSCVAVPGNAECLTMDEARSVRRLVSRGLTLPADLVSRAEAMAEDADPDGGLLTKEERARISHDADRGKYCVHARDGNVLGEHNDISAARYQLKGILECERAEDEAAGRSAPEPELPPLTGRAVLPLPPLGGKPAVDRKAELAAQIQRLFDPAKIQAEIEQRAEAARAYRAGRV